MSPAQHTAAKHIDEAQIEFLLAFHWVHDGMRWRHPLLPLTDTVQVTLLDAYLLTRADPTRLGAR